MNLTKLMRAKLVIPFLVAAVFGPVAAQPAAYPAKPIRVMIPFSAGGALDAVGRPLGEAFQRSVGQPWVIENLGGAGGTIATSQIAKAPPDGYQLLLGSNAQISAAPFTYPQLAYDPEKDLIPIVHLVDSTAVLYTGTNSPFRTVADVVSQAKAAPASVDFAHTGNGSVSHLGLELFAKAASVKFTPVPYKGAGVAMPDLASGQIPLLFTFVSSARPLVDAGRIRPLAVASEKRLDAMPNVPTFAELGYPGVVAKLWIGLMAPRGTPTQVTEKLAMSVNELLRTPELRARLEPQGLVVRGGTTEDFQKMIAEDTVRWRELSRLVDLTPK